MNGDKIMDYVYHGSKIQGLKKLEKRSSTHQQEWVYATPSKAVATIFINNGGSDFFYSLGGIGTTENPVVLVERKEGMFDKIFNLSGSLYTLKGDNFESGKTGWKAEVVSEFEEEVIYEEHIDNVLQKLNELAEQDNFQLYRYPNRPDYVPLDNSDLIPKVIRLHNQGLTGIIDRFLQIYPELTDKLNEELKSTQNKKTL